MDLKDIIKWFIPCFHIILSVKRRELSMFFIFLFVCLFLCGSVCAEEFSVSGHKENSQYIYNDTTGVSKKFRFLQENSNKMLQHSGSAVKRDFTESPRTFGRPLKKMMQALIPLAFQIGAASTWAVVAAIVGVKTLLVTLVILKLLLVAGAAKAGSLFVHKQEPHQAWLPPQQKEIHLHIHNTPHGAVHEHFPEWSRGGATTGPDANNVFSIDSYSGGPQTIQTPFGNYIKISEPPTAVTKKR